MSSFPKIAEVACHPKRRQAFREGTLRERWYAAYAPIGLFDEDDIRLARNQPWSHFYEWLAAVSLYETTGWLSLIEKYQFAHERKRHVLDRLGADGLLSFFAGQKDEFGNLQAPDLLVYAPDFSKYFFCEVKGPTDALRPEQVRYFQALRSAASRPIYLFDISALPDAAVQDII